MSEDLHITDAETIAALTAQLAERDAEVAALSARLLRADPPQPAPTIDGPFVMPSATQLARLFEIATRRWPCLYAASPTQFPDAVRFVHSLHRLPAGETDATRYLGYWCDLAQATYRLSTFSSRELVAACVAAGDIDYSDLSRWPYEVNLGLLVGSKHGSRRPGNHWLGVLGGTLREPLPLPPYRDRSIGTQGPVSRPY